MRGWLTFAAACATFVAVCVRAWHPAAVALALVTVVLLLIAAADHAGKAGKYSSK